MAASHSGEAATGAGGVRPGQAGSGGANRAIANTRSTSARRSSGSAPCALPAAVRPSRCTRSWTSLADSATFWWIAELANRVNASSDRVTSTSACAPGPAETGDQLHHLTGDVQLGAVGGGHARTPTRTLRNRAGAAGCPVCPIWPGWPLPQFGVPQETISAESMSIERQKSGPMPV